MILKNATTKWHQALNITINLCGEKVGRGMYINIDWLLNGIEVFALLIIGLGVLHLSTLKKKEQLREKKIYASSFIKSWNGPELLKSNRVVLLSDRNWKELNYAGLEKLIKEDQEEYFKAITLLNFFEEIAQAIEFSLADEYYLRRYFLATVISTHSTFDRFIENLRERTGSPSLFTSFEKMAYRWRNTPSSLR